MRDDRASSALMKCQQESAGILRFLQAEGFTRLKNPVFPYYEDITNPEPGYYLPFARSLALHLKLLWSIIQQRLVSIAVTYNPLMTALGYTYQGHESGWTMSHTPPLHWHSTPSSPDLMAQDQAKSEEITSKYNRLLTYGRDLSVITTNFRKAMSTHLGPTLEWVPGFEIAPPPGKFTTPSVFIPKRPAITAPKKAERQATFKT